MFVATCAVSVASCAELGRGKLWKPALSQLGIILIRRNAIGVCRRAVAVAEAGIRARRRLPVDHVHRVAIAAEAHRVRVPTGRNETDHLVARSWCRSAPPPRRNSDCRSSRRAASRPARASRCWGSRPYICASEAGRTTRGDYRDGFDDRVRGGVDDVNRIRLVFDDIQERSGPRSASSCSVGLSPGCGSLPPAPRSDSPRRSRGRECSTHTRSRSLRYPSPPPRTDIRRPARPPARGRSCRGAGRVPWPFDQLPKPPVNTVIESL